MLACKHVLRRVMVIILTIMGIIQRIGFPNSASKNYLHVTCVFVQNGI